MSCPSPPPCPPVMHREVYSAHQSSPTLIPSLNALPSPFLPPALPSPPHPNLLIERPFRPLLPPCPPVLTPPKPLHRTPALSSSPTPARRLRAPATFLRT
eukprot:110393-Chlamydomonas_euryale.AAC.2